MQPGNAASQPVSQDTLPVFQRSVGNQAVMRMLTLSRQQAVAADPRRNIQESARSAAFDQAAAVAYNQERFTYDQSLVEQLYQVASDRELYEAALAARQIGPEFAALVYAAQQILFPSATNDGKLGPASLRAVRQRTGHASTAVGLAANGRPIPERQVRTASPNDPASERTFTTGRTGQFVVTGGYMEASGHAMKRGTRAIFSNDPDNITALPDSGRNLGIDYVVTNRGRDVNAWYGGLVTHSALDGGYGYRVIVETDVTYLFNGREYTVFQGYGHNSRLHVRKGSVIDPGARIATMGGTGRGGADRYPDHVDLRTWIMVDGQKVDVSPNLLDQQIATRRQGGGPQAATRQPGRDRAPNDQARTRQRPATAPQRDQPAGGDDGGGGGLLEEQMAFTTPFEGRRPRVYDDSEGHPTVGIGFNLDRSDARRRLQAVGADYDKVRAGTDTLNDRQIDTLFRQDMERFSAAARGIVSNFDSLPRTAQLIIVDMTFNLGEDGFAKFRKAIAAFEQRDFRTAAAEMQDSRWYGQVGNRSRHHVAAIRALAEAPQAPARGGRPGNAAPATDQPRPGRARVTERPAAPPRAEGERRQPATGGAQAGNPIGTATVTADVLNVRQGPAQTADRVGRLQRSQVVQVLGREGDWLRIRFGSTTAFIHGDHVSFRPARQPQQQEEGLLDQMGDALSSGVQQAGDFLGNMWDSAVDMAGGWFGSSEQAPARESQGRTRQPATRTNGATGRAPSRNPNAVLSQIETTGASAATARQDGHRQGGVVASERMAQRDFNALKQYAQLFVDVGAETGLPPALLAAIASRESRGGTALDRNGYGDHGNGFGLMQVDKRYHELAGSARSREHVEQAAGILKDYFEKIKAKFPRWSEAQQLRGAVAAYNFGVKNVQSLDRLDIGSTGDDYSADVWARARYYAGLPEFGRGADTVATTPQVPTRANRGQQPGAPTGSGRDISGITVSFGPNANPAVVSAYTLQVLKECLAAAGERSATITSTSRTPADQARAMYNNIVARGVASQRALYGAGGDQIITVYEASKAAGKDAGEIMADMSAAIQRIGPSRVSKHCADPAVLGVIDVGPSSVEHKAQFVAAVENDPRVSNFLHPGNSNDPAYHIEIPQR